MNSKLGRLRLKFKQAPVSLIVSLVHRKQVGPAGGVQAGSMKARLE